MKKLYLVLIVLEIMFYGLINYYNEQLNKLYCLIRKDKNGNSSL